MKMSHRQAVAMASEILGVTVVVCEWNRAIDVLIAAPEGYVFTATDEATYAVFGYNVPEVWAWIADALSYGLIEA